MLTLILTSLTGFSLPALAHFHYEIALDGTLRADQKQLKALDIVFLYDPEVSRIYLDDQPDLNEFGPGLVKDLAPLHYFTEIRLNGKSLPFAPAKNARATTFGQGGNTRLKVSFTLPLAKPVTLSGKVNISLLHKDSTASATLYYASPKNIHFSKSIEKECHANIRKIENFKQGDQPQDVDVVCVVK